MSTNPDEVPFEPSTDIARWAGFPTRVIRAMGRHCADADPSQLAHLLAMRDEIDLALDVAIAGLRNDYSWAEIARALGITRQGARQVYGHLEPRAPRTARPATTNGCHHRGVKDGTLG